MFTNRDLRRLIIPLVVEQILAVTVGMADTVMVAVAGEAAVSGIALVDTLNLLLINIFAALATGGAVVTAQYLGKQEADSACAAAKQLIYSVLGLSVVIMAVCLAGCGPILRMMFGNAEPAVMTNAEIYLSISAMSYPFIALYNAGAALFRAMGNSRISMFTAAVMNVVNIGGNYLLIYSFGMGVKGAAIASLASRALSAVILLILLQRHENIVHVEKLFLPEWRPDLVGRILGIGLPNGLENGMFQIGKIMVQGLIASFGTTAIAANAVANNVATMETLPGSAIGLALITVMGQCVGAGDYDGAKRYVIKLMKTAYLSMLVINIFIMALSGPLVHFYGMSEQTTATALQLLLWNSVFCIFIWPSAFTLPNALRAAGDAKFTMIVSVTSMWLCRIGLSYLFANQLGLGVLGVWLAMFADWVVRMLFFVTRFLRGGWKNRSVV